MSTVCAPAACNEITAVYFLGRLIIRAKGSKPTPCDQVRIQRSPLLIFPPEYVVETCRPPGICIDIVTPYDVTGVFFAPQTDTIRVHCAEGVKVVPVRVVRGEQGTSLRLTTSESAPSEKREAVGYSDTFDFREAFQDAIRRLPPDRHPFPDKLVTVRAAEIGGLFGGLAGVSVMFVRVEAE